MKNNCPYLQNHKKCSHKYSKGDCIYSNPEKCRLWQESPSEIIKFVRGAKNYITKRLGGRSDV